MGCLVPPVCSFPFFMFTRRNWIHERDLLRNMNGRDGYKWKRRNYAKSNVYPGKRGIRTKR